MQDDKSPTPFVEVMPSAAGDEQWLVSGPKIDDEEVDGDLMIADRSEAIDEAKYRGQRFPDPVTIFVLAGYGNDAEEWVEEGYINPFVTA